MFRGKCSILMVILLVISFSAVAKDKVHKVVIQVSSADPVAQKIALNNAVNLQKHYGVDNIVIEVVAYGPGLKLFTKKHKESKRVASLAVQDIKFSACQNTIKKMTKKTGKAPVLTKGVGKTPSGAARVIELQEKGYAYLRP